MCQNPLCAPLFASTTRGTADDPELCCSTFRQKTGPGEGGAKRCGDELKRFCGGN